MDKKVIKIACLFVCLGMVGCNSVKPGGTAEPVSKVSSSSKAAPDEQANQLMAVGKFEEAIKLLEPYVAKMPVNWKARVETADKIVVHYWDQSFMTECFVGEALGGKKVDAIVGESYSRSYYLLAYSYLELKNATKANENLDRALALEPDSVMILAEKGTLNQITGNPAAAVDYFQKAIDSKGCKMDRDLGKAYRGLGVSLIDLEKLDEAEKALYTSLKYSPNNKTAIGELNYIDQLRAGKSKQPISPNLIKTQ